MAARGAIRADSEQARQVAAFPFSLTRQDVEVSACVERGQNIYKVKYLCQRASTPSSCLLLFTHSSRRGGQCVCRKRTKYLQGTNIVFFYTQNWVMSVLNQFFSLNVKNIYKHKKYLQTHSILHTELSDVSCLHCFNVMWENTFYMYENTFYSTHRIESCLFSALFQCYWENTFYM